MENRAHQETYEVRLKRFRDKPPNEIISTLLASIDNHLNNEISLTIKDDNCQTVLAILGIHSVAVTIGYIVFNKKPEEGYKSFLVKFVDGNTNDTKFSKIANSIHNFRNLLAHQWLGASGHSIDFNYFMKEGWIEKENKIFINPKIYVECYLKAFELNGKIWGIRQLPEDEKEGIKSRFLERFISR